jgi:hypothetical protein
VAEQDSGGLLKAAISGIIGAALGIMITYSTGVASNRTEIVRLATKVDSLTSTINNNMNDRYRGQDAQRDFNIIREKIVEIIAHDAEQENEIRNHLREHEKNR